MPPRTTRRRGQRAPTDAAGDDAAPISISSGSGSTSLSDPGAEDALYDSEWYLGAYCKYLSLILPRLREYFGHDLDKFQDTLSALHRIVFLDMGLAIETYIHAGRQALRGRAEQLAALNKMVITITSSLSLNDILHETMRQGIRLTHAKAASIAFYDAPARRFRDWVTQGLSEHFVANMSLRPGGLADEAFNVTGRYILSNDRPETKHKLSKLARDKGIQGFICVPLVSHASRLGVLYFYLGDRDVFDSDAIALIQTFAALAAEALDNARLHALTVEQALTDALTGLPNRRALTERLTLELHRAQRHGRPFAVMMLDIDHFKQVNDTHGHPAGDAVLKELAQRLRRQVRDLDLVGRYGGEEFLFVLAETDSTGARVVAERIRRAVAAAPFTLSGGQSLKITVSVGVACLPYCAESIETLVERADQALFIAKFEGRDRVVLYREMLKAEIERNPGRVVELLNQSLENIEAVVTAIGTKAPFFRHHTQLVVQTAADLARQLRLSEAEQAVLRQAAMLHDVGMLFVPDAVLGKTTALTLEEWKVIREHPIIGARLLEQVPALRHLAPIVRAHHERYDGSGYPEGLKGDAIPSLARLLVVADAYGSMIADWPGRKARTPEEVRAALTAGAGTQFDPLVAGALLEILSARS